MVNMATAILETSAELSSKKRFCQISTELEISALWIDLSYWSVSWRRSKSKLERLKRIVNI
jgi:hypothetical protein